MNTVACPHCGQFIGTEESWSGGSFACPSCGGQLTVPTMPVSVPVLHPGPVQVKSQRSSSWLVPVVVGICVLMASPCCVCGVIGAIAPRPPSPVPSATKNNPTSTATARPPASKPADRPSFSRTADPSFSRTAEWYQGGTLHQANLLEWKHASHANRLATAADFVAKTQPTSDFEELRKRAEELERGISIVANGPELSDSLLSSKSVSEIAAAIIVLEKAQR